MDGTRHLERRETLAYWPAQQEETGEKVGLVTDITEQGINLHSETEFPKGRRLHLRIATDRETAGVDHVSLQVQNVWCRKSEVGNIYHSGFKILEISKEAQQALQQLLRAFSFPVKPTD